MSRTSSSSAMHPIQVVVRRAGISADVLRAWERRYGAVTPGRSETGRRLYSDADIERLRLIKEVIAGGRRIGDVATMSTEALGRLAAEDDEERAASAPRTLAPAADFLTGALAAVRRADAETLRSILSRALLGLAPIRFIEEVATPLMHQIGEMWERGELSPAHEHIGSEIMRQMFVEVLDMLRSTNESRSLVVATPSGQRHELGALLAAATAALDGWRVTYLGPDLPAPDIARIALETDAAAVALSVTAPDANLATELTALRRAVGRDLPILVGGQQVDRLDGASAHVDRLSDLESFRAALASLSRS